MQIDRERLALALVISDYNFAGIAPPRGQYKILKSDVFNVDSILADIEAQGFVIIPREPSENTQLHGRDAISDRISRKDDDVTITAEDAAACWRVMIAAATAEKGER